LLYDDKYEYVRPLGEGGFGKVFLALEKISRRQVAIKQLHGEGRTSFDPIIREIQAVSKFNHPNIVHYYTHFWQEGKLFLVMEYCARGSLRDMLKGGLADPEDVMRWMITLTKCLHEIHKKKIIHCDIKPENILVNAEGVIKISDFGIANTAARSPAYWSPDEIEDYKRGPAPRTDIYALGVTLLELLTGRNPFRRLDGAAIVNVHRQQEYGISGLPQWQQSIILRAIHPVPEERFRFMSEFTESLQSKSVPVIFNADGIRAAKFVEQGNRAMKARKWQAALSNFEYALQTFPDNVMVLSAIGRYYLQTQQVDAAKVHIHRACKLNRRLNLQKELGWIHLEQGNYAMAISLLSDHLHRQGDDLEAYNLLVRCYYETGRYELGMQLCTILSKQYPRIEAFRNNYFICRVMADESYRISSLEKLHPFILYNHKVISEDPPSYNDVQPTRKAKLLFMDWQVESIPCGDFTVVDSSDARTKPGTLHANIISVGRNTHDNEIPIHGGVSVSRRHCVVVNCRDASWIYDLGSTSGTFLNGRRIDKKAPVIGLNKLKVGAVELTVTTDRTKLL
jgi:serine/threonine protein kinase